MILFAIIFVSTLMFTSGFLPYQNPPSNWPITYDMQKSTLCMALNKSGWDDPTRGAKFGIVSYDWSNYKSQWVLAKPMDCEVSLAKQAEMTKKVNPHANVFVYRNLVKALPWFSSVRQILDNPQYSGFFLKFKGNINQTQYHVPPCTNPPNPPKCSIFYHDQKQTPEVPSKIDPDPDGKCDKECDCGSNPCGEYLFDHRNGTMLTEWLLNEYIVSNTGLKNPAIDGFFIDDYWCSDILNKSCSDTESRILNKVFLKSDPRQGPSEINNYSQTDMGLSSKDIEDITIGWLNNMKAVQNSILKNGGYTWSLIPGQANANAGPLILSKKNCIKNLKYGCSSNSIYRTAPLISGVSVVNQSFTDIKQQVAGFLLMRGPYAYIGYGEWGMEWPSDLNLPGEIWGADYGVPNQYFCIETSPGVFSRDWSKTSVTLNCNTWEATGV